MLKNYFKIAWRNLLKHKGFTFINLIGLATGFAITLLIVQYVRYEMSYEETYPLTDRTVRLTMDYMDGETVTDQDSETNPPLGPLLVKEFAEVEDFTRAYQIGEPDVSIRAASQNHIAKKVYAADPSFFTIFNYPLLYGNEKEVFQKPNQAVLTESTALKFFNRKEVVGETVELLFSNGVVLLDVVGVIPDSPANTHLKTNMLISYATMLSDPVMREEHGEAEDNWDGNNTYTYALLTPHANYATFQNKLVNLNQRLKEEKKLKKAVVVSQKIKDIHLYSNKTFEPEANGNATSVYFLLGVAFLVIISAFVNYINLATSRALDRAKEVGVRKVVGSTKSQLRVQFLVESFLINLAAGVIAVTFIWLAKSQFIQTAGLPEGFSVFADPFFWRTLSSFILLGIVLSGIYPAIVLSSFKPALVLKGNFSHSTRGIFLRKGLVVFQFMITIILLIQTFTVSEQLEYLRNLDKGVSTDNIIVVNAPSENKVRRNFGAFKQELLAQANVKSVSASEAVPGQMSSHMSTTNGIKLSGTDIENSFTFYITYIDAEFIPQMQLELLAGNNFEETGESSGDIIVNEEAIRLWQLPNPEAAIGKKVDFWGQTRTIRGVLKNYHQESPKSPFLPTIYRQYNSLYSLASVQFTGGDPKDQVAQLKKAYKTAFPNAPFNYFFMDTEYEKQYKADERFKEVFGILTGFSILIACLGLLGLASFTVSKRRKEIGIRKVIGASVLDIMALLSRSFVKTVMISMTIGIPITYFLTRSWLDNFAFRIDLHWWLFVIPVILVLALVIISVSASTLKTALANPVDSLKDE